MHALAAGETFCSECGRPYGSVETEPFALKPGTILDGKYLVGEMLGQGGFGITYIGFDLLLEQKVAIKEYYPMSTGMVSRENSTTVVWSSAVMQKSGMEKGFDSFLKEARKMAKLGGIPGVVGVKSVFIQNNIMVQSDGKLILLDLGAAKDLDIQGKDGNVQSSQMVAKHGFSPVEQYGQAGKIGPWTDVYAMAATIYYCCTGVLPPSATDRMIEDTLTCRPRLTKEQFDVLAFCMNVLPQNRPQNMDALLQIVTHPAGKTPPVRDVPKTEPVRPETRNLQPLKPDPGRPLPKWLIPGIAAAVAVIALIISVGSGGKKSTPASSVKAPAAQAVTTEPVPTVPMEVHTMAVADYAFDEDAFFWGQERYMRKDVKTLTFQSSLQNVPSSAWDVSEAGDGSVLAWMDNGNLYVAADGAIAPNSNASCLLQDFANLKTIDFGNCFDTSNVTDMHSMFAGCSSLTSLDLSGFDTSNVTYMSYMFQMCDNLSNVDLSSFSTSNVTNMRSTFESCGSLIRLDLTSFDTSKVTDMNSMFYECGSLTQLNLTSFDTSKVTDMAFMFTSCNSLTSLDLSNFDTSNVTNMLWMFGLCYDLTSLNLSNFDTSAVTEMDDILTGCDVLTDLNCSDARILKEYSNRR